MYFWSYKLVSNHIPEFLGNPFRICLPNYLGRMQRFIVCSLLFLCNMLPRLSISTNDSLVTVKWTLFFPPPFWDLISSELLCVFSVTCRWFTHTQTHARTHTRVHGCEKFSLNERMPRHRASGVRNPVLIAFGAPGRRGTGMSHAGMDAGLAPAVPGAASLASQTLRGRRAGAGAGAPPRSAARECRRERLQLIFPLCLWKSWFNFTPAAALVCCE